MTPYKIFQREVNFFKNIYFFVIFVALILYIFFNVIAPSLSMYKKENMEVKKNTSMLNLIENDYNQLLEKYNNISKDNQHVLRSTSSIYDEVEISGLLDRYFTSFELTQKETTQTPEYTMSNIEVKSLTTNPENFYLFVQELPKLNSLIEISYPLEFESQDGYLNIVFMLKVYTFY